MDAPTALTVRRISALADLLERIPTIAAQVYANGGQGAGRARPIVEQHFTAGNQGRNRWKPLTRPYAAWKAGRAQALKAGMRAGGRVVPRGANLPMLVLTGTLRQAVVQPTLHRITQSGDTATIIFSGLPDYAAYLHDGTPKMPRRSPVKPGPNDRKQMIEHVQRLIKAATGKGAAGAGGGSGFMLGSTPRVLNPI